MATKNLFEKIEALPAEKKAEVEHFVDALAGRFESPVEKGAAPVDDLLRRIHERRERLYREHGLFPDSTAIIRDLRDSGT